MLGGVCYDRGYYYVPSFPPNITNYIVWSISYLLEIDLYSLFLTYIIISTWDSIFILTYKNINIY